MKKFFFMMGFCVFSILHGAKNPNRPEAIPSRPLTSYENFMRNFSDFIGMENYGFHALKESNQQYIATIIHELNMDDYCIEIRGMSNAAQWAVGRMNAFVKPSIFGGKSHTWMFVSEEWFESLSEGEKQGLIRHELMHIKCNHAPQKVLFALFDFCLKSSLMLWFMDACTDETCSNKEKIAALSCWLTASTVSFFAQPAFSRFIEKEADIKAAKTMKDKQGIIDLMIQFKDHIEDPYSRFAIKKAVQKAVEWLFTPLKKFGELLSTHPTVDERIEYLKALTLS